MLSAEISERERLQSELQILSLHDELTGLLNRRGFMLLAEYHWRLALRVGQEFALLYMDLNDFKQINDTFGHAQGDQALCDITRVLEETFRDSDILGRLGGDEFVALLVDSDMVTTKLAITRLQESLGKVNETRSYTLSLSIGLTEFYPNNPASITDLLEQADADMYKHKQQYHKRV
jgi:diguanylate cyclase (GGDEF)-like protein